uniref:Uncharacterized protein n=1 Tax=Anguilla anguilla TaxID=7936 RepID=A0A0E9VM65_ANGAN
MTGNTRLYKLYTPINSIRLRGKANILNGNVQIVINTDIFVPANH